MAGEGSEKCLGSARLGLAWARLGSARAVSAQLASSRIGLAQPGLAWLGSPRPAQLILGRLSFSILLLPHICAARIVGTHRL